MMILAPMNHSNPIHNLVFKNNVSVIDLTTIASLNITKTNKFGSKRKRKKKKKRPLECKLKKLNKLKKRLKDLDRKLSHKLIKLKH